MIVSLQLKYNLLLSIHINLILTIFNKNYNKMEKKIYVAPAMRAVQMRHKCRMLDGSPVEPVQSIHSSRRNYTSVEADTWQ